MKTVIVILLILILVGIVVKNFLARRKEMRAVKIDNLVKLVKEKLEEARTKATTDHSKKKNFGTIEMLLNGRSVEKIPLEELEIINQRLNTFLGTGRGKREYVPGQKFIPPSQKIEHARQKEKTAKYDKLREKARNAMKENKEQW